MTNRLSEMFSQQQHEAIEKFVKDHPEIKRVDLYNDGKATKVTLATGESAVAVRSEAEPFSQPAMAVALAYHRAMEKYVMKAMEKNAKSFVKQVNEARRKMAEALKERAALEELEE